MPDYGDCQTAEIDATPQACFGAMTDYERLPEWQGAVRRVDVLERDAHGRGRVVEYEVDARVKRVRYCLRQIYDEPHRIASEYLEGSLPLDLLITERIGLEQLDNAFEAMRRGDGVRRVVVY